VLKPGGVLFGCTVLSKGVERGLPGKLYMGYLNACHVFTNKEDDLEGLKRNLAECFSESSVKVVGCVALFSARK
jgi:hypothetical protein